MFAFFENLIKPFPPELPARPPATLFAFCWHYTRGVWPWILVMSSLVALAAVVEVMLFAFLGNIVDWLANADKATFLEQERDRLILIGAIVLFALPVISVLLALVNHQTIIGNYPMRIRWLAHRYLLRQSFGFYQDEFAGRIATKVMQTALGVRDAIMKLADVLVYVSVYFLGGLLLIASFDLRIMLPFIGWLALYIFVLSKLLPRLHEVAEEQADARSMMTGRVVDSYTNIHSVKLFAHNDQEIDYAKEAIEESRRTFAVEMRLYTIMDIALVTLNGLLVVGVVGWAVALWMNGLASVGVVAAATALTLRLNGMTGWIMWAVSTFFRQLGVVAEGMETIAQPITLVDAPDAKPLKVTNCAIEIEDLSHHYGRGAGGLDRLSLSIKPGEKIGLIGRSGAGKSTLVKLLLRFYEAEGGRILIDDQDIAKVTQDSLRGAIGMVQQDSSLLHRSVRENILYGRPDATEAQMIEAATQAEAHEFILDLKDPEGRTGYEAQVGERGVKLSGGQRQRVALARVILKNAPILVLDEATSALDSEIEAAIQHTLYGMMEGKTVIAIAHRLSTIAQLDRILVLDDGRIVEDGPHHALLAQNGLYAQFWNRQSGGFIGTIEAAE